MHSIIKVGQGPSGGGLWEGQAGSLPLPHKASAGRASGCTPQTLQEHHHSGPWSLGLGGTGLPCPDKHVTPAWPTKVLQPLGHSDRLRGKHVT